MPIQTVSSSTAGTPSTLYVPWFAPDESDGDNTLLTSGTFGNNYLNDEGGTCTASSDSSR